MKITNLLFSITLLFALSMGTALAEAKNGFSLNLAEAIHIRDCGGCKGSSTSGFNFGADYQIALSNTLSINPFLMFSAESNRDTPGVTIRHDIAGLQLRYWAGDYFFGGHLGRYSEVISNASSSLSGSSGGAGLVVGWERPDNGWYVMGQFDSSTGYSNVKVNALRFGVGYRWK